MNTGTINAGDANAGSTARIVNIILGVWLVISAFAWPHSPSQMTNTWVMGALAVVFALIAMFASPQARHLNTAVAVWLFISAFALPSISRGTVWNNVVVSIVMFACSLVPGGRTAGPLGRGRAAA